MQKVFFIVLFVSQCVRTCYGRPVRNVSFFNRFVRQSAGLAPSCSGFKLLVPGADGPCGAATNRPETAIGPARAPASALWPSPGGRSAIRVVMPSHIVL